MCAWEQDLATGWASARVIHPNRIRHPSGAVTEVMNLVDTDGSIFCIFHSPATSPRGLLVICSPPYSEAIRNQRRELLLAWLAVDRNLAAVRFHPRGSGHSGGNTRDMTLDTIQLDAETVARAAAERLEAPVVGCVGARLGGVVAHRLAAGYPAAAVAWWHPVLDADAYMRELFRARMIGDLKRGSTTSARVLRSQLEDEGTVDILGSPVTRAFIDSLQHSDLANAPDGPRSGLLVQLSRHDTLQRTYEEFHSELRRRRWEMKTLIIPDEEAWWFGARPGGGEHELRTGAMSVIPETVGFFESVLGAAA